MECEFASLSICSSLSRQPSKRETEIWQPYFPCLNYDLQPIRLHAIPKASQSLLIYTPYAKWLPAKTFWQCFQDICKAVRGVIHCSPRELVRSSRMDVILLTVVNTFSSQSGIIKLTNTIANNANILHSQNTNADCNSTFSLIYLFITCPLIRFL